STSFSTCPYTTLFRSEPIDVEGALQVIVFVLQDAGEPSLCAQRHRSTRLVDAVDRDPIGALEREVEARHRQAPFALLVGVWTSIGDLRGDEQGIDEGGAVTLAVVVVGVDDEDRLADADLRGGQADAV